MVPAASVHGDWGRERQAGNCPRAHRGLLRSRSESKNKVNRPNPDTGTFLGFGSHPRPPKVTRHVFDVLISIRLRGIRRLCNYDVLCGLEVTELNDHILSQVTGRHHVKLDLAL
ncbi:hypothetical protein M3J09_006569 [Ascochyta lentis]